MFCAYGARKPQEMLYAFNNEAYDFVLALFFFSLARIHVSAPIYLALM